MESGGNGLTSAEGITRDEWSYNFQGSDEHPQFIVQFCLGVKLALPLFTVSIPSARDVLTVVDGLLLGLFHRETITGVTVSRAIQVWP